MRQFISLGVALDVVTVELHLRDVAIMPLLFHQLIVRAHLRDAAVLDDDHQVGLFHRADAMGDDERGAALKHEAHAAANQVLGFGIDGGGRIVEHQHARVGHDRPGDGQALPLAARERCAALAEHGLVTFGQCLDEFVRLRQPRGRFHFAAANVRPPIGDVGFDGVAEEIGLLEHECHLRAQAVERDVANVSAVDDNSAGLRIVKPRDQVHQRGLSRAGWPDDGDHLPAFHFKRHIVNYRLFRVIPKRHMLEFHTPRPIRRQRLGVRSLSDGRRRAEHFV